MKKLLKVPFFTQEKDDTCGLAVVKMLVEHYLGKKLNEEELEKKLERIEGNKSFHIADKGRFLDSLGLKTELYCYDLEWIFSETDFGVSQKRLKERLFARLNEDQKKKKYRKPYLDYLKHGGKLKVSVPKAELLEKEIAEGNPVLILVESRHFYGDVANTGTGHAVLVIGYDDKYYYIHDPLDLTKPHAKGKNAKIRKEVLVYCWYRRYGNTLVARTPSSII